MQLVPPLPLSLQELIDYYRIAAKECEFLIGNLEAALGHLEARMKPSPLVSVQFNKYESYFVAALEHLHWRLSPVCVDAALEISRSPHHKRIQECIYEHSGVSHPIGEEEILPMLAALRTIYESLIGLVEEIEGIMLKSIFLCHASADKPFVRQIASDLIKRGSRVWLDEAEIKVGDSILSKIAEGIKNSDYLGIVLSEKSVASVWVGRELEAALASEIASGKVKVIPILLTDCEIPVFLKPKRYADFRTSGAYASSLEAIVTRLKEA